MSRESYDVVAAEVHRKAMENLTNEMAIAMLRTSGSPVVVEAKDFSACFLDTIPEHLGFAAYVLCHIGSSLVGTTAIARASKAGELRPGDGWLVNDPYEGGALHQGDVGVIMPTFLEDQHMGWSFVNMHVLDVGGGGVSGYAPGAHSIYEEGLRFPPIKIIRDGAIDGEWEHFIAANVRAPGPVINDIRSMISGCNVAAGKLAGVVREFGLDAHLEYCAINKDLSEQVLRDRIARIPDGVYETIDWAEFDGHEGPDQLLEMRLRLEVDGTDLKFSVTSGPQIEAFINSTYGPMFGQMVTAVLPMLGYGDLPLNGGVLRPISLDLGEKGTLLNAEPPGPVSNAHGESAMRCVKMAHDVLSQAVSGSEDPVLRSRVKGQAHDSFPGVSLFGANQHGGASVIFYADTAVGNGGGAQSIMDGQDCYGMTPMTDCGLADVEGHEATDPVLFLWRRMIPNSGGPGQHRGGQALEQAFSIYKSPQMSGPGFNACAQIPPRGFGGGGSGSAGDYYPIRGADALELLGRETMPVPDALGGERQRVRSKVSRLDLLRGDVVVVASGGGGGVGDPLLRDVAEILKDLRAGYITREHATAAYGVVLDVEGLLDEAATADCREAIRAARIGCAAAQELRAPKSTGVSIVRTGDQWSCGHCDGDLGDSADWRDGATVRERPLVVYYDELHMYVRERNEEPTRLVREHFCPVCAAALGMDIGLGGEDWPAAGGPLRDSLGSAVM
jgi:N-methylhydantoinase B